MSRLKRFSINTALNVLVWLIKGCAGLFYIAFLVRQLGIAQFGIVSLALSLTLYLSIFDSTLRHAIGRHFTIQLSSGQNALAAETLAAALQMVLSMVVVTLPLLALLAYFAPTLFHVSAANTAEAQQFMFVVLAAYLLQIGRNVLLLPTFALSRFDMQNSVILVEFVLRFGLVVPFFLSFGPALRWVGLSILLGALFSTLSAYYTYKKLLPSMRLPLTRLSWPTIHPLLATSGWIWVTAVGVQLLSNSDLILISRTLSAEASGVYGALYQWVTQLNSLTIAMATVVMPHMLVHQAQNDPQALWRLIRQTVRMLGLLLALPVGLLIGFGRPLLQLWLGPEFAAHALLFAVLMMPMGIIFASMPLSHLMITLGKVRWLGSMTLVTGVLSVGARLIGLSLSPSLLLLMMLSNGFLVARSVIWLSLYAARQARSHWSTFLQSFVLGALMTLLIALASFGLQSWFPISNWGQLAAAATTVCLVYLGWLAFSAEEELLRLRDSLRPV